MQLFHYHLVTSRVREVEARYIGKLAFDLVARHGRIGEELTSYEAGIAWHELDAMGFKLRLTELDTTGGIHVGASTFGERSGSFRPTTPPSWRSPSPIWPGGSRSLLVTSSTR